MTRIIIQILYMVFLFFALTLKAGTGANNAHGDSVLSSPNILTASPGPNSVIEKMSDEQLVRLIDMLFELDSIPSDLAAEINRVVSLRIPRPDQSQVVADLYDSLPGKNFYSVWDEKHVLPMEDLLLKKDTSFALQLTGEMMGSYTHPCCGPVTSWFGWRDSANHNGIDIQLRRGDPVVSAFAGKVRIARREGGFGNVVIIRHYNGLETIYAHLSKIKVKPGQMVQSGQLVGLGGSSGHSTGPHLHFEVRFKGVPINPVLFVSVQKEDLISGNVIVLKTRWGMSAYPAGAKMYTVQKGDKLINIAKKFNTTTKVIRELNAVRTRYMYIRSGQQIRVE